ncbi:MAG: ABC transporter permease [Pseudomonadota bacterium]
MALILRETRVTFGTAQLGYLWAIANPIFGTAILTLVFSFVSRVPPIGSSFVLFFATGVLPYELYRKLTNSLMSVFDANRGLLAYPLVKEPDVVIARFLLIFATYLLVFFVFFGMLILMDFAPLPDNPGSLLAATFATAMLGLGIGSTNAVIKGLWKTWPQIEGIISRPMFFISGVFFIPTLFPPHIQYLLSWNPVMHSIEWFREAYFISYESQLLDRRYLFMVTLSFLMIGFGGERLYRKKMT